MQSRKLRMTPGWLDALKPADRPIEYRDTDQRGLVLRVEPTGRLTWVCRYTFRGRDRRLTLGTYPEKSLKAARTAARGAVGQAAGPTGIDPQLEVERLRIGQGVHATIEAWLEDAKQGPAARWKGGLKGGSARSFLPHVRRFQRDFGSRRLNELTPRDVERFVAAPVKAGTRNRALTALRGLMFWAGRKGLIDADPTAKLKPEREAERSRVLSDAEVATLLAGFEGTRYGRAVRLLALTGLRRDEVLGARWAWYDADAATLTIPADAEKAGRARGEQRRVALSRQACALLTEQRAALFAEGLYDRDEGFIFATSSATTRPHADALKAVMYRLRGRRSNGQPASTDKRAKERKPALPDDATIHDLRRTVADALLNRLATAPWVVDHVVLGHVRPKLLRTYMPTLPLEEARAALTRWAELVDGLSRPAAGAVAT
jgi:integrase